MKFFIKANMIVEPIGDCSVKLPIRFFMVDGGPKRGFTDGNEIVNDMEIADEFRDATQYNNIMVGRSRDLYSSDFLKLCGSDKKFDCRLEVESCSEDGSIRKFIDLYMNEARMSSIGITTLGAVGAVEKFRFSFSIGTVNFGSCTITK